MLRNIHSLECSEEFRASNFGLSSYFSEQNKEMPKYYVTQDGYSPLVIDYTVKESNFGHFLHSS